MTSAITIPQIYEVGMQVKITNESKPAHEQRVGMIEQLAEFGVWVRHKDNNREHHPFGSFQTV